MLQLMMTNTSVLSVSFVIAGVLGYSEGCNTSHTFIFLLFQQFFQTKVGLSHNVCFEMDAFFIF